MYSNVLITKRNIIKYEKYYIYILTNQRNTTLYTGVTCNLRNRLLQHKSKTVKCFTKNYNINKLIYLEEFDDPISAISRVKQIKGGSRRKKIDLIEKDNPNWIDLSKKIFI